MTEGHNAPRCKICGQVAGTDTAVNGGVPIIDVRGNPEFHWICPNGHRLVSKLPPQE